MYLFAFNLADDGLFYLAFFVHILRRQIHKGVEYSEKGSYGKIIIIIVTIIIITLTCAMDWHLQKYKQKCQIEKDCIVTYKNGSTYSIAICSCLKCSFSSSGSFGFCQTFD